MSSSNRATSKGGKVKPDKLQKSEKSDSKGKGTDKQQQRDANSKNEDPSMKDKVKQLIEMSHRSEEEVCLALHECDNDVNLASNMLFEEMRIGEWETRVKKKKNRQTSTGKQEKSDDATPVDDWNESGLPSTNAASGDKDKPRGGNRGGRQNNRGWRGRERQENDRNLEDRPRGDRERRGRTGGGPRGGGGGRGGRGGGRAGGRYLPRGGRNNSGGYNKPIDTWDNSNTWDNSTVAVTNHNTEETWDDFPGADEWSTEEYQGSLADTKVFTPSNPPPMDPIIDQTGAMNSLQDQTFGGDQLVQHSIQSQSPVPPMMGSLTAAQTQYFSQLQQNNDSLNNQYQNPSYQSQTYEKATTNQYTNNTTPYNSATANQYGSNVTAQSYGTNTQQYGAQTSSNQYGADNSAYQSSVYVGTQETPSAQQPARTKTQRARVPPPSKIPASAVEMPGDLNASIGYLDVQFGALDIIDTNSSFDSGMDTKYSGTAQSNSLEVPSVVTPVATTNLDLTSTSVNQNSNLDTYSPKTNAQNSISSAMSQSLSNTDTIPQTSDHLTNTYNSAPRTTTQGSTSTSSSVTATGLDLSSKQPPDTHSYSQSSTYSSYQPKSNTYNSSTYSGVTTTVSSFVSNQASTYATSQTVAAYNAPSGNTYPSTYSSNTSYQSNTNSAAFPSISQANTYSSNTQSYPQNTSQSVYGANTGLNNSSSYGNTTTSQYNNYGSSNKIGKESSGYDNSSSTSSSSQTTSTSSATTTTPLSLSQAGVTTSKTSTTLAAKNSNSIVSNIPPSVAPVMSMPYIGQVPYFQQPVYSYEEVQMLQQRLPHMFSGEVDLVPTNVTNLCIYPTQTTPYYDMSYQTPTTLAAVRDAATLGNVGYSLSSDGRFARTDNNASPVPTTLSQQTSTLTQGHQAQPILAGTGPPYFFATAFNTIAPNYQFGAMYTQLPAATNAHGSSNSTQYSKPASYNSGYGNYDSLNQSQDYSKGGYVSNTQGQKSSGPSASSTGSTGTDLSAMYAKSHTALGKVNSYEKQGFHSGTPPPFTGGIHGNQSAGLAPSGTGFAPQMYISTMAPHQQHHTTHLIQQPLHQDTANAAGQRTQGTNQAKASKQPYQTSYWNQA
ncbi:protein lingerer isoform X2 [Diorhabda sublineata]|uniref:protein lingerer isoform X2 n=1 Tax=Diorhabda sublineata TaxID=1163346 RepID=UPI0024E1663D|nr:protein lingerer isoform X2 [Diorhabda sublineata]XP_056647170.1 protein lingerer isoform X2 [Diorhabda sublineata]